MMDLVDLADELVPLDSHLSVMRDLPCLVLPVHQVICLVAVRVAKCAKCATMRFDAV